MMSKEQAVEFAMVLKEHFKLTKKDCEGEGCENEECQVCCDHEYDPSEGMMCLNCGAEYGY